MTETFLENIYLTLKMSLQLPVHWVDVCVCVTFVHSKR